MLMVISPAKKLDFSSEATFPRHSSIEFKQEARELVRCLRKMSASELSALMGISRDLGRLNFERYRDWQEEMTPQNARQAILAFKGDVYKGMAADDFTAADFDFAQKRLRILSGLYGVLKPLDSIQAYRLEMGTRLLTGAGNTLYDYWGDKITDALNRGLHAQKDPVLINLASHEYFKAVRPQRLEGRVLTPSFKERRGGEYTVIGLLAKRARGAMVRYIVKNAIDKPQDIQSFDKDGYGYNRALSDDHEWVFTRDKAAAA